MMGARISVQEAAMHVRGVTAAVVVAAAIGLMVGPWGLSLPLRPPYSRYSRHRSVRERAVLGVGCNVCNGSLGDKRD
jgi:hypothetical protein